jgi:hypothetical protein
MGLKQHIDAIPPAKSLDRLVKKKIQIMSFSANGSVTNATAVAATDDRRKQKRHSAYSSVPVRVARPGKNLED